MAFLLKGSTRRAILRLIKHFIVFWIAYQLSSGGDIQECRNWISWVCRSGSRGGSCAFLGGSGVGIESEVLPFGTVVVGGSGSDLELLDIVENQPQRAT